eukprot:901727_1
MFVTPVHIIHSMSYRGIKFKLHAQYPIISLAVQALLLLILIHFLYYASYTCHTYTTIHDDTHHIHCIVCTKSIVFVVKLSLINEIQSSSSFPLFVLVLFIITSNAQENVFCIITTLYIV